MLRDLAKIPQLRRDQLQRVGRTRWFLSFILCALI